jgi:hypothetical protein
MRLMLLGVGAMNSPRYAPAGLLVEHRRRRVMLDGGPGAEPDGRLDAWLVTDERGELMGEIRRLARAKGIEPAAKTYSSGGVTIKRRRVVHTSHKTFGYLIEAGSVKIVWAPEFFEFPRSRRGSRPDVRRGGRLGPPDPFQRRSRRARRRALHRARGAATRSEKIGPGPHRTTYDQGH